MTVACLRRARAMSNWLPATRARSAHVVSISRILRRMRIASMELSARASSQEACAGRASVVVTIAGDSRCDASVMRTVRRDTHWLSETRARARPTTHAKTHTHTRSAVLCIGREKGGKDGTRVAMSRVIVQVRVLSMQPRLEEASVVANCARHASRV